MFFLYTSKFGYFQAFGKRRLNVSVFTTLRLTREVVKMIARKMKTKELGHQASETDNAFCLSEENISHL